MLPTDTEYLRVKQVDTDAGPITVTRAMYEFNPDAYKVLEDEAATDAGNTPLPSAAVLAQQPEPVSYDDWKVAELKQEIGNRNADRDPADDNYLDGSGNKADLISVLAADDATQPGQ